MYFVFSYKEIFLFATQTDKLKMVLSPSTLAKYQNDMHYTNERNYLISQLLLINTLKEGCRYGNCSVKRRTKITVGIIL